MNKPSSKSKSGFVNKARARANLILQPPENSLKGGTINVIQSN